MNEFPDIPWSDNIGQELKDDFILTDAGQGWHRIGKTKVSLTRFIQWSNRQPTEVSFEIWKSLPANQRGHDFLFEVDIAEFDQRAKDEGWDYSRRVQFKSDDWFKILVPSFEEIFGEGSMKANSFMSTIGKVRDAYVDWLDVPQSPDKNGNIKKNPNTDKPYTTLKLVKVFTSREEAAEAYNNLSSGNASESGVTTNHYPAAWQSEGSEVFIAYARTLEYAKEASKENNKKLIAEMRLQTDADDNPTLTTDGNPVDVKKILAEIRNMPEDMIEV